MNPQPLTGITDTTDFTSPVLAPVLVAPQKQESAISTDTRVVELRSLEELQSYRQAWDDLLAVTPEVDFFYTVTWLENYWKHFGRNQQLRVVVVLQGDTPMGIVPFVIAQDRRLVGNLRVLTYPLDWWGSFYGPIGPRPAATLRIALQHIKSTPRDWDFMELRFIPGEDEAEDGKSENDPTFTLLEEEGFAGAKEAHFKCARIALTGTWEEYLATRRKSWRTNMRRTENKTLKVGEVEHVRYRPAGAAQGEDDPRWDLYDECLNLAKQSWQGSSQDGHTLSHDNVFAFFKDLHQAAAISGHLDLNLLRIDGQAVAFHYGYHWNGYFSSLRLGFDPAYAKLGVGTVLTGWMIRDCYERGDHTFDFLPDCLKAKLPWQTSVTTGYRYSHYPSLVSRAQVVRLKNWINSSVLSRSIVPS